MSSTRSAVTDLADTGFPAIASPDARILILGSLPGQRSLREQQYYAHPQNAFWPIMRKLVSAEGSYEERCAALRERGIALWDVLLSSGRPGSMDADIRLEGSQVNDFARFFSEHTAIERVGFNGQTAAKLFRRLVEPQLRARVTSATTLPSTSPAYAAMPYAEKLRRWRDFITTK